MFSSMKSAGLPTTVGSRLVEPAQARAAERWVGCGPVVQANARWQEQLCSTGLHYTG